MYNDRELQMSVNNIKTTIEAVLAPYIIALEQKYKEILDGSVTELARYHDIIENYTARNEEMMTTITQQNQAIAAISQTVEGYAQAIENAGILDAAQINAAIDDIRSEITQIKTNLTAASQNIANDQNTLNTLSDSLDATTRNLGQLATQVNDNYVSLTNNISDLSTVSNNTINDINTIRDNIVSLGNTVSSNNTAINNRVATMVQHIADTDANVSAIDTRVSNNELAIENNRTATDEAIMQLETRVSALEE